MRRLQFPLHLLDAGSTISRALLLIIICCIAIPTFGQTQSPIKKGEKWKLRWKDYHERRADGSGNMADPNIMGREFFNATRAKEVSYRKAGSSNWTPCGPDIYASVHDSSWEPGIGRINCIAFHPTDSNIFWVGVAQGGVWKTVDHGQSWIPTTDDLPILRISDIALDPNDPNTLYISVGDYAYIGIHLWTDGRKRHTHYGMGVYKSIDGGLSWKPTGLSFAQTDYDASLTRRVFVNPANSLHVIAAGTQGIWKSTDAGNTFTQVIDSLLWDIEQDPQRPNVLYASGGFVADLGEGYANIMKSTDFGDTWTVLNTGITPQFVVQRIELAISPQDTNYVYALACDMAEGFGGLYRSTNAGSTWTLQSQSPNILHWSSGGGSSGQGSYDLAILVDPNDKDRIYTGGVNMWTSGNGGANWDGVTYWRNDYGPSIHADQHQFKFNPADSMFYICNDGGLYRTDSIKPGSWVNAQNQPGYKWPTKWEKLSSGMQATSFYRLGLCRDFKDYVIAGAQDNSTYYYDTQNWWNIIGGDGMDCMISPWDPDSIYGSWQYGGLVSSADGGFTLNYNFDDPISDVGEWTTPIMMHPKSSKTIFAAYGDVWKTTNDGLNWSQISNFPIVQTLGYANPASAMEISPVDPDIIYVAKRLNLPYAEPTSMWVTTDGGANWIDRTMGLPDSLYITDIQADDTIPNKAWVTIGGFTNGVKLFKTTNAGQTWTNETGTLPNLPINCIATHPEMLYDPLYVGTDVGVYYTNDTIASWIKYSNDLPNVIVSDLEVHEGTWSLWCSTFGRGLWKVGLRDTFPLPVKNVDLKLAQASMDIFPNPSESKINIQLKELKVSNARLEVVDQLGRIVINKELEFAGTEHRESLEHGLRPGAYHIRILSGKAILGGKFIVME